MGRLPKQVLFATLTISLGLGFSLLLLELGLRVLDWPSPGLYVGRQGPLPLSLPDENGSCWREYAGSVRLRHWDYDVEVELNAHGFIEREAAAKAPGQWRVGIFGDSFAAGMGVRPDERFATRVAQHWRDTDSRVEVYNFGSAWSGTAQSAAFLARHAAHYELDEIVLAVFGGNELMDNRTWERSRKLSEREREAVEARLRSGRFRDWLRNASRAAGFLYVTLSRGLARRDAVFPTAEVVDELWPLTEQALQRFADAAAPRPLSVWYLPGTAEWDDDAWAALSESLALPPETRHQIRDRILGWAGQRGLPSLDLTAALAGAGSEIRFPNDGHWNVQGHERVARWLAPRATPALR